MEPLRCLTVLLALALPVGCARGPSMDTRRDAAGAGAGAGARAEAPRIERIEPTSGPAGEDYPIDLTIYGGGFADTNNVVHFGSLTIANRPSTNGGTQIIVAVPKITESGGEVPPFVLQPGEYPITVTTARGTSEPVMFRLTREFDPSSDR